MSEYTIKKVVRGIVEGEAVVCPSSFSFMGDVDLETAEIIAADNPNKGHVLTGKILLFNETKGSSGGSLVLMTLANSGKAPAAIISVKAADFNLTEGAILAKVPYGCNLPLQALEEIKTGQRIIADLDNGLIKLVE